MTHTNTDNAHTIVLAGGCFWGVEKFFSQFPGIKTTVGYANGTSSHPTYRQVCSNEGSAEAVEIRFDDSISPAQILALFFEIIDPFSVNKQGNDAGIQYRSGVYSNNAKIQALAKAMLEQIERESGRKTAVEVGTLNSFYPAEEYHQNYLDKNPGGYCHLPSSIMHGIVLPSLGRVEAAYPAVAGILKQE